MKTIQILTAALIFATGGNLAFAATKSCAFTQFFKFELPVQSSLALKAGNWRVEIVPTAYEEVVLYRAVNEKTGAVCDQLKELSNGVSIEAERGVLLLSSYSGSATMVDEVDLGSCANIAALSGSGVATMAAGNALVFSGGTDGGQAIAPQTVKFDSNCKVK